MPCGRLQLFGELQATGTQLSYRYSAYNVRLHGCVRHTPASPTSSPAPVAATVSVGGLYIRSDCWPPGSPVIGLIASALQIQRTMRVIAYGAVSFSSPLHRAFSPAPLVNNDTDSSDGSRMMYFVVINTFCWTFAAQTRIYKFTPYSD